MEENTFDPEYSYFVRPGEKSACARIEYHETQWMLTVWSQMFDKHANNENGGLMQRLYASREDAVKDMESLFVP